MNSSGPSEEVRGGLFHRRRCWLPTFRGWFLLLVIAACGLTFAVLRVQPFLAVTDSVPGGALVVEGWVRDCVLEAAISEFRRNRYTRIYVTGGPLEKGAPLSEYRTHAQLGAAILKKMGLEDGAVRAVPAAGVSRDRTFASALTLKNWLRREGIEETKFNVVTIGPHARRTRFLFAKVLGEEAEVGIIAVEDPEYDPARWWKSSQGFRSVTGELIAYVYSRLLFTPPKGQLATSPER